MAESLNTTLADAQTDRQLQVGRVETQHRREVWAILTLLETDILTTLKVHDPTEPGLLAWRRYRVEQMMDEEIAPLITSRYAQLATQTTALLVGLAQQEVRTLVRLFATHSPAEPLETPPSAQLRRAVTETPFPSVATATELSTTHADWWTRLGESLQQRLGDQLLLSVSLDEDLPALLARVRGTGALGHTDGLMARAKTDAARLLRTAVTNTVSTAREAVAEESTEAGLVLEHSSIIDSKTSSICIARDGLQFTAEAPHEPIGHSVPYLLGPPYHNSCRSSMILLVPGGGAVAGGGFEGFLRRQAEAVQREILGPGRWELWKEGKLTLRNLLDAVSGKPLTLDELEKL